MPTAIQDLLTSNHLHPRDFEEQISRSSGPGGQHANKVSTAIRLRHLPTGLAVVNKESRSLFWNRLLAYRELIARIQAIPKQATQQKQALAAKKRRQARRRSRKTKEIMIQAKRTRSEIKHNRNKISSHSDH